MHLDFIRPGRPVENGYIESFNGKLRDECLNVEVFFTLADARRKLALWLHDYNHHRPHSALADRTPANSQPYAAVEMTAIKPPWKTLRVSHFPTARRLLAMIYLRSGLKPLAGDHHLSYINRNRARQTGTNRTTQAEISNLRRHSFPGRVTGRNFQPPAA